MNKIIGVVCYGKCTRFCIGTEQISLLVVSIGMHFNGVLQQNFPFFGGNKL
jgi:hypothetical protein